MNKKNIISGKFFMICFSKVIFSALDGIDLFKIYDKMGNMPAIQQMILLNKWGINKSTCGTVDGSCYCNI